MEPSNPYGDGSESKEEAKARIRKKFGQKLVWDIDTEAVGDVAGRHINNLVPHMTEDTASQDFIVGEDTGSMSVDEEINRELVTLDQEVGRICSEGYAQTWIGQLVQIAHTRSNVPEKQMNIFVRK